MTKIACNSSASTSLSSSSSSFTFQTYFPCLHELFNGYLPLSSVFRDLKSLSTTRNQVFQGLPFRCCPSLVISLHFFTMLSSLHLFTPSNHLNLLLLIQFLMPSSPKRSLGSEEGFLSFMVTCTSILYYIWLCSNLNKSASFTAHVSLPYNMTLLTLAWYTLPFKRRDKPLQVRTGRRSLNFFHPDLVLAVALSSAPPPALILWPS